jgi:hypothetical protein
VRLTTILRASVLLAALATGSFGGADLATLALGVTPAGANEFYEFYTRKHVRGRWITGHFTRRHRAALRRSADPDARSTRGDTLPDDPDPTPVAPKANAAAEPQSQPEPVFPVRMAQPGTPAARSGAAAPLARDERLQKLQEALHAHARTLASNTEPPSDVLPAPRGLSSLRPVPASPEPKAVSFDFQSGVKTTVFTDGTKVEEPFDPAAMKGLAAARPNLAPSQSGR